MKPLPPVFHRVLLPCLLALLSLPRLNAQTATAIDSAGLVSFVDGLMKAHLKDKNIAGATVSIVHQGRLLFAKGYGYTDLSAQKPVEADKTLFRIGSISKLFVWTAVMQLVEQGKLDLTADVNTYLKEEFKVPEAFGRPITLKDLMTHSAGLEEQVIGLFGKDEKGLRPLGQILLEEWPQRVRPPGEISAYSNHGTGLAAYIVEQVSGQSFDDYVEQHIFQPLNMQRSSFRQPLPATLAPLMSKGYSFAGGEFKEESFEYVPLAPVGAAASTATDMAHFMLAHLQLGVYQGKSILDSATAKLMHSPLFRHEEGLNALAHGFYELNQNGKRIIGHGGDTFWFHSMMALIPEEQTGIFISSNSQEGGSIANEVVKVIIDRLFPGQKPAAGKPASDPSTLERFSGDYRSTRFAQSDITRLSALMGNLNISATEDGRLRTSNGSATRYWLPVGPTSFREENGTETMVFRTDPKGSIQYLFFNSLPIIAFEPVPPVDGGSLHLSILAAAAAVFLLTIIGWSTGAYLRRKYRVRLQESKLLPAPARMVGWLASLSFLTYYIGLAVVLADPIAIAYGLPPGLKIVQVIPFLCAVLTLVVLGFAVYLWLKGRGRWNARLYYTLLAIACGAAIWQLFHWNLLGFHF